MWFAHTLPNWDMFYMHKAIAAHNCDTSSCRHKCLSCMTSWRLPVTHDINVVAHIYQSSSSLHKLSPRVSVRRLQSLILSELVRPGVPVDPTVAAPVSTISSFVAGHRFLAPTMLPCADHTTMLSWPLWWWHSIVTKQVVAGLLLAVQHAITAYSVCQILNCLLAVVISPFMTHVQEQRQEWQKTAGSKVANSSWDQGKVLSLCQGRNAW